MTRLSRHLSASTRHAPTPDQRRFVAALLVSCFGLLAAILAFNFTVDPFALAGTNIVPPAVETDRKIKLDLLEELPRGAEILILGSSRARVAEPSVLERHTGHHGFNAGVTSGTAADAWVWTRYAADLFPRQKRRYVWFIDVAIATNGINPQLKADRRARKYLPGGARFSLKDVGTYLGPDATRSSWRVLRKCKLGECHSRIQYRRDGSLVRKSLRSLPERTASLKRDVDKLVAGIRRNPPQPRRINPERYVFFERAIRFMNERGERPVIVLNPIHPRVLAELRKYGYPGRAQALEYLREFNTRADFVVVDCQDIRTWGGKANDFSNATHVNILNMRRMLRYIARHSAGTLR